jgi:RNA polymerase sigma factor (sigma-70 family)
MNAMIEAEHAATDRELLEQYALRGSEEAFQAVVERHLGLVRGIAMRQLGNGDQADEASHAVFIALARKAASLPSGTVVAGWLFRATRFAAAKLARDEGRRTRREREAAMTHAESVFQQDQDHLWNEITPHLNEALECLAQKDRDAVLLRFFESRSFAEVGAYLGASEDAAKMRVGRALERLRGHFRERGYTIGAAALASVLSSQASTSIPENLANSVAASVAKSASDSGPAAVLSQSILRYLWVARLLMWLKLIGAFVLAGVAIAILAYQLGWFWQPAPMPPWP